METNSVKQIPLEADTRSAGETIFSLLWNPKIRCHFYKTSTLNQNRVSSM
jgi:hypothetical protein